MCGTCWRLSRVPDFLKINFSGLSSSTPLAATLDCGEMEVFVPGQRWMSESEPELGLGTVLNVAPQQVLVVFRASGSTRQYAIASAPLKRVRFREGDMIRGEKDQELKVTGLREENGLITYLTSGGDLPEPLLSDQLSFSTPRERLLAGHVDDTRTFDLRARALQAQHQLRKSPVRGLLGPRITLIPHQLYIAGEVGGRFAPRVLLADEVGLGKTIESCLILHRLLLTGRVSRVLILVPESLVHQWFVELLRKFNLWFAIFDEERCVALESSHAEASPFTDDQLVICSLDLLARDPKRAAQALAASWDLLIVDEAHHLEWSAEAPSQEYSLVEALAKQVPALFLLTATPHQLGEASHFARLRLLDPHRFNTLENYLKEIDDYARLAPAISKLAAGESLSAGDAEQLSTLLGETPAGLLEQAGHPAKRPSLLARLLDQHGTSRLIFRNTRAAMSNFPKRVPHPESLVATNQEQLDELHTEFLSDADPRLARPAYRFKGDPRVLWLSDFLRADPSRKVLLICRYREKAEALDAALRERINTKIALFHENLPLIQRDRNAAWFSEEDGAQILIASEIGSEGRNFQFAHTLVLFDLPLDPELLEQRIGRLDRIGQTADIQIYIPFIEGSAQEVLFRWYHEGLDSFARNLITGGEYQHTFRERLFHIAESAKHRGLDKLLRETAALRREVEAKMQQGRDRLLELHSFNREAAAATIEQITQRDQETVLDQFLLDVFDEFGLHVEELGNRSFQLGAGDLFKDKIPGLPTEGLVATLDRARAVSREDYAFLTWDHPMVTALFDLLLGSEKGNSAFALWPNAPAGGVLIEAYYLLETNAPRELHLDRFLAPTPLRILLNHKRNELTRETPPELLLGQLKNGEPSVFSQQVEELGSLLPGMIRVTQIIAEKQSRPLVEQTVAAAKTQLAGEIERLEALRKVNPAIREDEIAAARKQAEAVLEHLAKATVRLDAVRLIIASGPKAT